VKETKPCECGCGDPTARHFRPGHDARLKSQLRRAAAAGDRKARAELRKRGWPIPVVQTPTELLRRRPVAQAEEPQEPRLETPAGEA
jgi:hypothetical protein